MSSTPLSSTRPSRVGPGLLLLGGLALGLPASAQDDDSNENLSEETITGSRLGGLDTSQIPLVEQNRWSLDHGDARYSARARRGAEVLHTSEPFVADAISAVEALYHRHYADAKQQFADIGARYPGSAMEPVGQVLVWQALMLENFDFKYVSQYELALKRARSELEEALLQPGNDAYEYFILGGMLGIDSIHTMRTGEYVKALNRGIEAMKAVAHCKELAPDFVDAKLGDGLFNYWRTVIARSSKAIPDMGDHRAEGISQIQDVERDGIFLGPPATLSLVFTWMEEGDMSKALAATLKNQQGYPDNLVNTLVLGRVYMYMRRYSDSEATFTSVIAQDPKNERVYYYLTRLYMRTRNLPGARRSIDAYLAFNLDDESRGYGLYQKGLLEYREKNWDAAEGAFQESYKLARIDSAKQRVDMVRQKRAGG